MKGDKFLDQLFIAEAIKIMAAEALGIVWPKIRMYTGEEQ